MDSIAEPEKVPPTDQSGRALFRKIVRWTFAIAISVGIALWANAKWNDWQAFQTDLTSYRGVSIGLTKTDVQYALGSPQTVQGPERDAGDGWTTSSPLRVNIHEENASIPEGYDPLPKGKTATDYNEWHYWNSEGTFDVVFNAKSGRVESIHCWQPGTAPCPEIFGIGQNTQEKTVLRLLGKPDKEEVSGGDLIMGVSGDDPTMGMPAEVSKSMDYHALGLRVRLTKKEVYSVTKRAPQGAGLDWWLKHRLF